MTIEEQAQALEKSLITLEAMRKKPWLTTDDRRATVQSVKAQVAAAERTLQFPATSDTAYGRQKLILWTELAHGTLKSAEYNQ